MTLFIELEKHVTPHHNQTRNGCQDFTKNAITVSLSCNGRNLQPEGITILTTDMLVSCSLSAMKDLKDRSKITVQTLKYI